jgi:hypothetical protein
MVGFAAVTVGVSAVHAVLKNHVTQNARVVKARLW